MILIENGTLIPLDGTRRIIPRASIAVEGNTIAGIGDRSALVRRFGAPRSTVDAAGKFVFPGFINTHTHLFQAFSRGLGMDLSLDGWWRSAIGKVAPRLTTRDIHDAAVVGCLEAIRSGTTTVNDFMYLAANKYSSDAVVDAFGETGVRCVLSRGIMDAVADRAPAMTQNLDEAIEDFERLHKKYDDPDGRVSVWVAPSAFWSTSLRAFEESVSAARRVGARITFHCSETESVVDHCKRTYGLKDVSVMAKKHLLGPDVLAVHCVWLGKSDIETLARYGVSVSHCPLANMILADGVAPIREMLRARVTCSLGTDGPASNNNQDMLGVMKSAALLQKIHYLDPLAISAWKVLEMATVDGAKALGKENTIGSLKKGYRADIVIIDFRRPYTTPVYDPVANLVYAATPENVETVMVDGRVVMEKGRIESVDEQTAVRRLQGDAQRLGVGPLSSR